MTWICARTTHPDKIQKKNASYASFYKKGANFLSAFFQQVPARGPQALYKPAGTQRQQALSSCWLVLTNRSHCLTEFPQQHWDVDGATSLPTC